MTSNTKKTPTKARTPITRKNISRKYTILTIAVSMAFTVVVMGVRIAKLSTTAQYTAFTVAVIGAVVSYNNLKDDDNDNKNN